jgi:porin
MPVVNTPDLRTIAASAVLWLGLITTVPSAQAEESEVGRALADHGVTLRSDYVGEFAANPSGGIRQGQRYTAQASVGADLDLGKLAGVEGGAIHLAVSNRHGRDLAAEVIGSSTSVQEIFGGGQTTRLNLLSYEQHLLDGSLDMLVGRIAAMSDFAASPIYCNFQTNAVCGNPAFFGRDSNTGYWFSSNWGGRIRAWPTDRIYVQAGAYAVDPHQFTPEQHGLDWSIYDTTGVLVPVELGYATTAENDPLPRHYRIGGYYDDSDYTDPLRDIGGGIAALSGAPFAPRHGRTGVYAFFDQMVWRPDPGSDRGLTLFGGAAAGVSGRLVEDYYLQLGLLQRGTFTGRDQDTIGFVVTDQAFSSLAMDNIRFSRVAAGATGVPSAHEVMLELNYGAQVTPWLRMMPNLQYVIHPDQLNAPARPSDIPDTFVVGLKFTADLAVLGGLRALP